MQKAGWPLYTNSCRSSFDATSQNEALHYSIFSHLSNLRPIKSTEFLCTCSLPTASSRQIFLFLLSFSKKGDYKCLRELKSRHLAVLTRLRTRLDSKKSSKDSDYMTRKREAPPWIHAASCSHTGAGKLHTQPDTALAIWRHRALTSCTLPL